MNWKAALFVGALGGVLLLAGTPPAQARDRDRGCAQRIRQTEWKLRRDIQRHGYFSRQAAHRREQLRRVREQCFFRGERDGRWFGRCDRDRDDRWRRRDRGRDDRWRRRDRDDWWWRRR